MMEFIAIGRIAKPIGVRGEVKILPLTHTRQRFADLRFVWVGHRPADAEPKEIRKVRIGARDVGMGFIGVDSIQDAGQIKDQYLFIPENDILAPQKGSYLIDEVIGCEMVTEAQGMIGTVIDVFALPYNDVWVVKTNTKEIFIPAVNEIIRQVDIVHKRITIHALDGLIE